MATMRKHRAGLSSLDYVLVLGTVFAVLPFILWAGPKLIRSAYEIICLMVAWPFM